MVLQKCAQNEIDYDELYQLIVSVATDFEIPNPFPKKERFVDIYRTLQGLDDLNWIYILEYVDDRSKFRVSESVLDEMEKNFIDGFQEVLIVEAENLALHLINEGILSIVLLAKITFAGGTLKELREFLQ